MRIDKQESAIHAIFRIISFQGSMRKSYFLGTALLSLEYILMLLNPELNRLLVRMAQGGSGSGEVVMIALIFATLLCISPLVALGGYLQSRSCAYGVKELRRTAFARVLSLSDISGSRTGNILARVTDDAEHAGMTPSSFGVTCLIRFVAVTLASTILLMIDDWRIALIALGYSALTMYISTLVNPRVRRLDLEAQKAAASSGDYLIEAVRNIFILRIFLLQRYMKAKYQAASGEVRKKSVHATSMIGLSFGLIDMLVYAAPLLGFLAALALRIHVQKDFSSAVYSATLVGLMGDAALYGGTMLLQMVRDIVRVRRVLEVIDMSIETEGVTTRSPDMTRKDVVALQDLTFSYVKGRNVLNGISLSIPKGAHIAFVGGSGGGKSTLVKIIASLYELSSGQFTLGGIPINDISLSERRMLCAYVPQECILFDCTIAENIGFGKPGAIMDEIVAAAKGAQVHDFIMTLPGGYDAMAGENGTQISGGQRQRIAIARAILKNAPLLLLDEATAALDSATEEEIMSSLGSLIARSTTVTVAHRLSTIKNVNYIYVIDAGKIVEEGTHSQLCALNGRYRELWEQSQNI